MDAFVHCSLPRAGGGLGWGSNGSICNDRQHTLEITQNFVIPKPQYPPTLRSQPAVTRRVGRAIGMLTTVQLDHQPALNAGEIDNVPAYRMLASKAQLLKVRSA